MAILKEIADTIASELSDLHDAAGYTRVCFRLLVAAILGGVLGYERERRGKSAGLRTHMLVAIGAALFVLAPQQGGTPQGDLTRVIQGVATGIGFLGAGAIIKAGNEHHIVGLTTAASIWITAAIGLAAGTGREVTAILATTLALLVLTVVHGIETRIPNHRGDIGNGFPTRAGPAPDAKAAKSTKPEPK